MLNLVEHNSLEDWWSISSCKLRSSEPEKANFTFISFPSTHRQALGSLHEPFRAERAGNVLQQHLLGGSPPPPWLLLAPNTETDAGPLLKPCWTQVPVNPLSKAYLRSPFGTFWPQDYPSSGSTRPLGWPLLPGSAQHSRKGAAGARLCLQGNLNPLKDDHLGGNLRWGPHITHLSFGELL